MKQHRKLRWYQYSLSTIFVVMTLVALWFGIGPRVRAYFAVRQLSNTDLIIDGNYFGLDLKIRGKASERLRNLGKDANSALQSALLDPSKFAAAHALLTEINEVRFPSSAAEWNNMRVTLYADGKIDLHVDQMSAIQQMWEQKLKR